MARPPMYRDENKGRARSGPRVPRLAAVLITVLLIVMLGAVLGRGLPLFHAQATTAGIDPGVQISTGGSANQAVPGQPIGSATPGPVVPGKGGMTGQ